MRQADIDHIVELITKRMDKDFEKICEKRISLSLHDYIAMVIKEQVFNSPEFKPILKECFTIEARRIIHDELDDITFPLTVSQMSAITGLSPSAIYQQKHRGTLNFKKKGGRLYISLKELNLRLLDVHNHRE